MAATKLQEASKFELSPGVSILQVDPPRATVLSQYNNTVWWSQAVTERKEYFSTLSFKFGRRLQEHLTALFVQQVHTL